jgi:hypothetical protein
MRDLINLLTEATGLAGRIPGDIFIDSNNNEVTFRELKFYPTAGRFNSKEEMSAAVADIGEQYQRAGIDIVETNADRGMLAFGVATFTDADNNVRAYIRYFQRIAANFRSNFWDNNSIPDLRLGKKSSEKLRVGYSPSEVLTQLDNLTPDSIVQQIAAKFGDQSVFTQIAVRVSQGGTSNIEVPAEGIHFEAFRDLFCEMLHPIALKSGFFTGPVKESATVAEEKFLGPGGFQTAAINFSASKTEGLSDSILVGENGVSLKISSKNKVGSAKASVTNLAVEARKMKEGPSATLMNRYKDAIEIIEFIEKANAITAPLQLARKFGIINEEELKTILSLDDPTISFELIAVNLDNYPGMTDNLKTIWQRRRAKNMQDSVPFFHMVSGVAHTVAEYINNKTEFSKAASAILNNGALVQIYTNVKNMGGKIILFPFQTQYPSETITGVVMDAGTRYKSTAINGKFGFQILKNGAKPEITDNELDGEPVSKKTQDFDPDNIRVQITPKGRKAEPRDKDSTPRQRRDK